MIIFPVDARERNFQTISRVWEEFTTFLKGLSTFEDYHVEKRK